MSEAPNPIDVHVGRRLRLARHMIKGTQENIAEALGLSFQQVQKYENGKNRISASMMWEAAKFLGVPVAFFFEGLPGSDQESDPDAEVRAFASTVLGRRLLETGRKTPPDLVAAHMAAMETAVGCFQVAP